MQLDGWTWVRRAMVNGARYHGPHDYFIDRDKYDCMRRHGLPYAILLAGASPRGCALVVAYAKTLAEAKLKAVACHASAQAVTP